MQRKNFLFLSLVLLVIFFPQTVYANFREKIGSHYLFILIFIAIATLGPLLWSIKKPVNHYIVKIMNKSFFGLIFTLFLLPLLLSIISISIPDTPIPETFAGWVARLAFFVVIVGLCPLVIHVLRHNSLMAHDPISQQKITRLAVAIVSGFVVISFVWFTGFFTPAMLAMRHNQNLARILFTHNVGINKGDGRGWTPLGLAIDQGDMDLIHLLIEKGADVNGKINAAEGSVWTPLGMALKKGDMDLVHLLIQKGADVNREMTTSMARDMKYTEDSAWTPLGMAIDKGDMDLIHLLIEKGADVNRGFKSYNGKWTPLGYAIYKDNLALTKFLIGRGADINSESTLFEKTRFGEIKGSTSLTPLMLASTLDRKEVVMLLLDNGANVNAISKFSYTALTHACWGRATVETIQILLDRGADINPSTRDGKTPLRWAVSGRSAEVVKFLINRGADINSKSEYDETLLMEAVKIGAVEIAGLLIDKGIDMNAKDIHGRTALMYAAAWGDEKTVRLLLERGADIRARNDKGETVIDFAIRYHQGVKTVPILRQYIDQNDIILTH